MGKILNNKSIKLLINALSILIVSAVIIWAFLAFFKVGKKGYTNDAQVEEYINPISTRIAGYVQEIRFQEHQHVRKGDTLVVLDNREYKIQLKQAESNLLDAKSGKSVASASLSTAENNVAVSEANIQELDARLHNARENLNRYRNLLEKDAVTKFQFDQMKTEYEAIKARWNALKSQSKSVSLTTGEVQQKLVATAASIARAAAAVDLAELNLSYTVITAPYDGIMGRRLLQEGQLLQASQTIGSIVKGGEKWIVGNYKETRAHLLKEGKKVSIQVDALDGRVLHGVITSVSAATGAKYSNIPVDNSAGNFVKVEQRIPVRIDFTPQNTEEEQLIDFLRAGMNVELKLEN